MGRRPTREKPGYELIPLLRTGKLPCPHCRTITSLSDTRPLSLAPCPRCKSGVFGPLEVNGFWLLQPLGGGGMGAVYLSYHQDRGETPFAVKVLPRDNRENPLFIEKLQEEAAVCRAISGHPCLVNFVDAGCVNGEHYVVTEFIQGDRLDRRIEQLRRIPPEEAIHIGLRLLAAETHIYNRGYLYRDLKPENVIVTPDRGAVLYDYGLCRPVAEARNAGEDIDGTARYFPPERILGGGETAQSEIYSLGMVLFHALTGEPYFAGDEVFEIARRHTNEVRVQTAGSRMKNVDEELGKLVDRMVRREPLRRHPSFLAVERELVRILAGRLRRHDNAAARR